MHKWRRRRRQQVEWPPKNGQVTRSRLVGWVSDKEVRLRLNRCNYCNCAQRWELGNFWNALQSAKRVATKTIRQDKFYGTPQLVCVSMCVCVCVAIGHWSLSWVRPHCVYVIAINWFASRARFISFSQTQSQLKAHFIWLKVVYVCHLRQSHVASLRPLFTLLIHAWGREMGMCSRMGNANGNANSHWALAVNDLTRIMPMSRQWRHATTPLSPHPLCSK